ncbi:hypothetical protein AVEN_200417-1 [Araneus ventricosus]|uniref:Uncharacterized protein n=1 Tax=Araneus ventricosus TaxID=182803 RepID=A0A4Y2SP33_ARAVE|nr:hypothetical protein AVEN_3244-1 [Araneus ventricosus]GBN89981.1 hypothetical protein AVEN_200417-1 [Araneus ventricosus]
MILYYRHKKNPRHQTCLWRALWKRDIPLHYGGDGKGIISFGADRTDGSLVSRCTTVENEFSPYEVCLVRQMLRLVLYPFASFLRLVYLRQPCPGFFSWRYVDVS